MREAKAFGQEERSFCGYLRQPLAAARQNLSHQDPTRWEHVRSLTPTGGGTRNEPRCPGAPARMCLLRALAGAREVTAYAPATSQP